MSADRPPVVVALEHRVNDLEELVAAMIDTRGIVLGTMAAEETRDRVQKRVAGRYEEGWRSMVLREIHEED